MSFINTVDSVGDKALADSIINRSITELNCNITTGIRQYAFRACAALEKVSFPSVTSIALGAFWQCTALTRAEFESTVAFANNAFYGCTALTALILRNTEAVSTITGTPFEGSAIASGTGYIYVPAALVDTYKANWSTYAAQIRAIEDYPGIGDPYSWEGVFANIDNGSYASVYKVGDLVPLDLGSEGVINMRIEGFNVDTLADGSGTASIRWIADNVLKNEYRMNPYASQDSDTGLYTEGTGAIGGWAMSELRSTLNTTIKQLFPTFLVERIKTVKKTQNALSTELVCLTQESDEFIWIPSVSEVKLGPNSSYARRRGLPGTYDSYFLRDTSTVSNNSSYSSRYARANYYSSTSAKIYSDTSAAANMASSDNKMYIALGFCT